MFCNYDVTSTNNVLTPTTTKTFLNIYGNGSVCHSHRKRIVKALRRQRCTKHQMNQPHDKDTLAEVLKMFYIETQKENGSAYSKSSLIGVRFDLNRHFLSTQPVTYVNINDPAFLEANKVFSEKCVELKRRGLAKVAN